MSLKIHESVKFQRRKNHNNEAYCQSVDRVGFSLTPHNWHILITIENANYTVAVCKKCALLEGGFIEDIK